MNRHLSYATSINFGVKDYLEGKFEGWMKRKGYDIQNDKFHDWFMNGYWGSEIKPKEDKYLEVYNYGHRLAHSDNAENLPKSDKVNFTDNKKIYVSQLKEGDVILTHKKYCEIIVKKKGRFITSKILVCKPLDGSPEFEIEKGVSDKITVYDKSTEFAFKSVAKAKKAHQSPVANFIIRRMDRLDQLINEAKASNKPYGEYIKESNFLNSIYSEFVQSGYAIDK